MARSPLCAVDDRRLRAIQPMLVEHGAVLFRGFGDVSPSTFRAFVQRTSSGPLPYVERSSPRRQVGDGIYTSTEYPAHQEIFPHNEHSYALEFPSKLYFYCQTPAPAGGQTTLVPTRAITRAVDAEVRRKFAALGWRYVRNLRPHVGISWREVFQCDRRSDVEEYCRRMAIELEWKGGDELRMVQHRPAIETHRVSGEALWFNHIVFFHGTSLPPDVYEALLSEFGPDGLPNDTFYGDGTPIEHGTMAALRAAYLDNVRTFEWKAGDVLVLDNMLCAHGRQSFVEPRSVLVAMADPVNRGKLESHAG